MRCFFILLFTLFAISFVYAESKDADSLTITTYYPSPYGVYRNLRLHPSDEPTNGIAPGLMYFDRLKENLYIYINDTDKWQPVVGKGGNTYTVQLTNEDCHAAGPAPAPCDCPSSFSGSPGPIPAGSKVISCTSSNHYMCYTDCPPDPSGEGSEHCYVEKAPLCTGTISGNTINIDLSPPSVSPGPCTGIVGIEPPSCGSPCLCGSKFVSVNVTYGN